MRRYGAEGGYLGRGDGGGVRVDRSGAEALSASTSARVSTWSIHAWVACRLTILGLGPRRACNHGWSVLRLNRW